MSAMHHEPARSYDTGMYLWGLSSTVGGTEHQLINQFHHSTNDVTVQLGYDRMEATFNDELDNWTPVRFVEVQFTDTQTGRIYP